MKLRVYFPKIGQGFFAPIKQKSEFGYPASDAHFNYLQGDTSGLGLGLVDFVIVIPLSPQNLGSQWNNQNQVNQTQSQTGCVTLYYFLLGKCA